MIRAWTTAAGLSLASLAAACEGPAIDSDFVHTDSAGITILESFRPQWEEGEGWTVATEPELAIGEGPSGGNDPNNPPWGRIRNVSVLSNGSLVVGDITTSEVMVFDTLGRLTHKFGGEGEGPGELDDFGGAYTCGGDTIIARQPGASNFFDSEGRFIRRLETVDPKTRMRPSISLTSADCRRFLVTDYPYQTASEGPEGLSYWVFAWTDNSFLGRDTVARVPARHAYQDGIFIRYVPWTASVSPIRMTGDDLVFGYSQRAELRVVSSGGDPERILRWHATPDPITAEERRRWNEAQQVGSESGRRVQLSDYPWLPEHKAFFDRLKADEEGNLWARALPPPDPAPERWTVLSSAGRWLGAVRMPDGFTLSTVARGRVYGVHRDELGVRTVRVYGLEQGG